jgi:alpha-glucuronidase
MNSAFANSISQQPWVPQVSLLRSGKPRISFRPVVFASVFIVSAGTFAQTADQAWLDHALWHDSRFACFPVKVLGKGTLEQTAAAELKREIPRMYNVVCGSSDDFNDRIVIGTVADVGKAYPDVAIPTSLSSDAYWIAATPSRLGTLGGHGTHIVVAGGDERGALYGSFALLRFIAQNNSFPNSPIRSNPAFKIRWVDEWDNPDGTIERGYAGPSIFFENGNVREDLAPVSEYGRLLASVGINGLNVNNVNAAPQLIDSTHLKQLARIADALRPWGVHLALSVAIASPQTIGGLKTYDPLDPAVQAWWVAKANEIYTLIPDFAGFTVKADSEGQPGPASFGRTPADAANTLAAALAPHGGIVLYRGFVYNHHLDWRDPKADRARAAYDIFKPLDGQFATNVVLQIKEGPIDFQAREPVSPLFSGLQHTSQAMEVQITQEYTGQQRHLVYLAPMWKQVLDFDLHANSRFTPVKEILAGKSFDQPLGGIVGVAGVGRDRWLGSPLALANLYAFGRLAWDPNLDPAQIAEEWIKQSISSDPQVVATVQKMLMQSWPAYEQYTGPLGLQTLTDITGSHYGPNIESSERNGWGQWHDADAKGVGKDRTVTTGSGFTGQYPPQIAKLYENSAATPENLLLFFHHVPYTWRLYPKTVRTMVDGRPEYRTEPSKTVIQYIYDSHYAGAAQAADFVDEWTTLKPRLDPKLYEDVRARLIYQSGHAIVWRDAVVQYFLKLSGIPDEKGRAGHFPGRLEAEDAKLTGYKVIDVTPWEDASRGKAVTCAESTCTAEWTWTGASGRYNIAVQYFDLPGGSARFTLLVNNHPAADWSADATLPSTRPNGDNSTRRTIPNVAITPGDTLRIEATPDGHDPAALDYIEITPTTP